MSREFVDTLARFTFHAFTLPLIYSTISIAVTIETLGSYWFVVVGCFVVMLVSYGVATLMRYALLPSTFARNHTRNERPLAELVANFKALRIAATFPNIVALPILIFPALCEYPDVYKGYILYDQSMDLVEDRGSDDVWLQRQCEAQSATMVFCCFFSWNLAFWTLGNAELLEAARKTSTDEVSESLAHEQEDNTTDQVESELEPLSQADQEQAPPLKSFESTRSGWLNMHLPKWCSRLGTSLIQTATSPGFVVMVLGFITACIPPLQKALFENGGALRFAGSALETLGSATIPLSTIVAAASLVPGPPTGEQNSDSESTTDPLNQHEKEFQKEADFHDGANVDLQEEADALVEAHSHGSTDNSSDPLRDQPSHSDHENPAMTDPNFGPFHRHRRRWRISSRRLAEMGRSLTRLSISLRWLQTAVPLSTPEMHRFNVWFNLSSLILTPAVVVGFILAFDCTLGGRMLSGFPNLAKLVLIIIASVPAALVVIVVLKSNPHVVSANTAATVATAYLPNYVLSIVTVAGWAAMGQYITLPDENGQTICDRP